MTIELSWWMVPIVFVVAGLLIGSRFKSGGDYDFVTPLIGLAIFVIGVVAAIMFTIGYWLGG